MYWRGKPQLVCSNDDLRPAFGCVWFIGDYVYATNGHIAIREHYTMHDIPKDKWDAMEGRCLTARQMNLLSGQIWHLHVENIVASIGGDTVRKQSAKIVVEYNNFKMEMDFADLYGAKAPNFEALFKDFKSEAKTKIGLNPNLLIKIKNAFAKNPYERISLHFNKGMKGIFIHTDEPVKLQCGILMPVLIDG
jgi:hypothetical protein